MRDGKIFLTLVLIGLCCLFLLSCGVIREEGVISVESGYAPREESGTAWIPGTPSETEAPLNIAEGTVPEGVSVLRVPMQGLTEEEAKNVIDAQFERLLNRKYALVSEGERLYLTADDLRIGTYRE